VRGVFVCDPRQCALIARINQIKDCFFLSEDAVQREALMAFALVCGAGCGQPQRYLVDGGFGKLTRCALGIDG
jgi:hypothetical protein